MAQSQKESQENTNGYALVPREEMLAIATLLNLDIFFTDPTKEEAYIWVEYKKHLVRIVCNISLEFTYAYVSQHSSLITHREKGTGYLTRLMLDKLIEGITDGSTRRHGRNSN